MRAVYFFGLLFVAGCETTPQRTYADVLREMPEPTTAQELSAQCGWIRGEIARMNSLSRAATTSQYAGYFQAASAQNIAMLEQKAADIQCGAAFGATAPVGQKAKPNTDACINECVRITGADKLACFKTCTDHQERN